MALNQPKKILVIKIYLEELMNKLHECRNYAHEDHMHILQSKWYYSVLKTTPLSCKGCFAPILCLDFDLAVPKEPISEWIFFPETYIV